MRNYIKLCGISLFSDQYAFVDTAEKLYLRVMMKNGIKIKRSSSFVKPGTEIRLIICKVRKKDSTKFESAIGKVRDMALLFGYKEYDAMCKQLIEIGGE